MAYEGYDAMYTGQPSKPGKTQVQIGSGLVEGDHVGFADNGDLETTGKVVKGIVGGGQRDLAEESTRLFDVQRQKGANTTKKNKR